MDRRKLSLSWRRRRRRSSLSLSFFALLISANFEGLFQVKENGEDADEQHDETSVMTKISQRSEGEICANKGESRDESRMWRPQYRRFFSGSLTLDTTKCWNEAEGGAV